MKVRPGYTYLAAFAMTASMFLAPAAAWEDDFHYGLTKWLALEAGYSADEAESVASRNAGLDDGPLDARLLVFWYGCISQNETAWNVARTYHFPTVQSKPSEPSQRRVVPKSSFALDNIDDWIQKAQTIAKARPNAGSELYNTLVNFAQYLHALQDSWSHQGEPAIPTGCSQLYSWGHPTDRGGWIRHRADLTRYWPVQTMEAAEITWQKLGEYALARGWPIKGDWSKVRPQVSAFQAARTKTEKLEWFLNKGFNEKATIKRLRAISLADGARAISEVSIPVLRANQQGWPLFSRPALWPRDIRLVSGSTVLAQQIPSQALLLGPVPADPARFLVDFWMAWVRSTDFYALASRYVSAVDLAKVLGIKGPPDEVARSTLALWRIADHGRVELLGHVPPVRGTQADNDLQLLLKNPKAILTSDGLQWAMAPGAKGEFLALAPAGPGRYAAIGRFGHAPYDVVMAVAEEIDRSWKITEVRSIVDR